MGGQRVTNFGGTPTNGSMLGVNLLAKRGMVVDVRAVVAFDVYFNFILGDVLRGVVVAVAERTYPHITQIFKIRIKSILNEATVDF